MTYGPMRLPGYFLPLIGVTLLFSQAAFSQEDAKQEPNDQNGDFRYVSDEMFTYLRSGPGANYRLLGSVNAGTKIQILQVDNDKGYAEVIDDRQRTGWIETRFVSREPSLREEVVTLRAQVIDKEQSSNRQKVQLDAATQSLTKAERQQAILNRQVTQQLEEIAALNEQFDTRKRDNNIRWFTRGAILALISLVLGYIMGLIGRKRRNNNRIM